MSNRRTRLNSLVTSIRRQSAAAQLGLAPEAWPYASVEVIRDDQSAEALAAAVVSRRAAAIRAAQELADWTGESMAVWEAASERFRTLKADEWPDGSEWGLIATVVPR